MEPSGMMQLSLMLFACGQNPLANPTNPNPLAGHRPQAVQWRPVAGPAPLPVAAPAASVPVAVAVDDYGAARSRAAAGEVLLVSVGVPTPAGYTALTGVPASVKPGLYLCSRAADGRPQMAEVVGRSAASSVSVPEPVRGTWPQAQAVQPWGTAYTYPPPSLMSGLRSVLPRCTGPNCR